MNNENPLEKLVRIACAGYMVYLIGSILYYLVGIGIVVGALCWVASL